MNCIYMQISAILQQIAIKHYEEITMDTRTNGKAKTAEYVIIGAGPAAICAIPAILNSGVASNDIIWIDTEFSVGDFGTILSVGSSVPGNTAVENYQKVNQAIYKMIPALVPAQPFEIDNLHGSVVCSLKTAREPMQHITNMLRKIIPSETGKASHIESTSEGLKIEITLSNGTSRAITTKRAILATGATAKTLVLPTKLDAVTMIHPNIVFIQTELQAYLQQNPHIKTVAVIGSSHSAALATMHLLKAGIHVKQFMNKEYKYATPAVTESGVKYTMYDNTGLKGDVAIFTRQLLEETKSESGAYKGKLSRYVGKDHAEVNALLETYLVGCTHAVATIGYEPSCTLQINRKPLSQFPHNNKTTEFHGVKGLFGIGVAFPQEVKAISGEVESAVGIGKFWSTATDPKVIKTWQTNSAVVKTPEASANTLDQIRSKL
jgi:thioredoxin reductase